MDIQRLRQILSELNPIFWNPEIDRQLEANDYPNQFPIESAKYRYAIALGKLVPHPNFSPCNKKSAPYRQMIIESRSSEKKRFNKLLKEVEECLSSYDNAIGVLLGEFTSPFAQQVLFTHQKLIGELAGITSDNYQSWIELLVCMSHKDFLADLVSRDNAGGTKKKRGCGILDKEVEDYLKKRKYESGIAGQEIADYINTKDAGKYKAVKRQGVEGTKAFQEYRRQKLQEQGKKSKENKSKKK